MQNFLISAYQSHLFNQWLSLRIDISHLITKIKEREIYQALEMYFHTKEIPQAFLDMNYCEMLKMQPHFFKIFYGDYMCHYPFGKNFLVEEELLVDSRRFMEKDIAPTGLLSGIKSQISQKEAGFFESKFIDSRIKSVGQRRYAWIFPENLQFLYKQEEAQGELKFFLPKGAYATNLLRELAHREIMQEEEE